MFRIETKIPCLQCKKLPFKRYGKICGTCYNRGLRTRSEGYRKSLKRYEKNRLEKSKTINRLEKTCFLCLKKFFTGRNTGRNEQKRCKNCVHIKIPIVTLPKILKECFVCHKQFQPARRKQIHCTPKCFAKTYGKKRDREKKNFYGRVREARIKGSVGSFTHKEWSELKNKHKSTCPCCGLRDSNLTIDHIIPISLGGQNTIDNIQPLCLKCNIIKGNRYIKKYDLRYLEQQTA